MNNDKFFKDKSVLTLIFIFIILTVINILYASFVQRGIVLDGSIYFVNLLDAFSNNEWLFKVPERARFNIIYLWQFPINFAYHILGISSKYWLGVIFSFPLFAFPAIVTLGNYFLAKRSKRWDLFLLSVAIFVLFVLPASVYSVVEVFLAAPIFFLLFHYCVADIDYKISDLITIAFLIAISYCSSEVVMYCSVILLFTAIYYAKKTENIKNKLTKYFIAINSAIMPVTYINFYRNTPPDFMEKGRIIGEFEGLKQYFFATSVSVDYIFITLIALIILFYNKRFFTEQFKKLIYILFAFLFLTLMSSYAYSGDLFSRRIIFFAIFPLVMFIGLIIDIFKERIGIEKLNNIIKNSLFVVLIIGIINTVFQIQISYLFNSKTKELNNLTIKNKAVFVVPTRDMNNFYKKPFNNICFNCDTYSFDSIAFNPNYKIDKIIIYDKTNPNCPHEFYFKDGKLNLPFNTTINIKNKFWDMTPLQEKLENNKALQNKIEDTTDTTSYNPSKEYDYIFDLEL